MLAAIFLATQSAQAQFVESAAAGLSAPVGAIVLPVNAGLPQTGGMLLSPIAPFSPSAALALPSPISIQLAPALAHAPAGVAASRGLAATVAETSALGASAVAHPRIVSFRRAALAATRAQGQTAPAVRAVDQLRQAVDAPAADAGAAVARIDRLYTGKGAATAEPSQDPETLDLEVGIPIDWVKHQEERSRTADPSIQKLQRKAQAKGVGRAALNQEIIAQHNNTYTNEVPVGDVTDQKLSGRCWIFANLNMIRSRLIAEGKIGRDFEFSQNFLYFFSQLEQANSYLEKIIRAAYTEGVPSIPHNLQGIAPHMEDGGHFAYFQFLVEKYGLVPKSAMPETKMSGATEGLDEELNASLGITVQEMLQDARALTHGSGATDVQAIRERGMDRVWKILAASLGTPPARFEASANGKQRSFTPLQYAKNFAKFNADDYVQITAFPYEKHGVAVEDEGSALGAAGGKTERNFKYLNVGVDRLEQLAVASIRGGQSVGIFAAMNRDINMKTGIMHPKIYDRSKVYDFTDEEKRERLTRAQAMGLGLNVPDHLMALTGFDRPDPKKPVVKFKVENSWGPEAGDKGVFHMYREWFRANMFGIIVHKSFLSKAERTAWTNAKKHK